MSFHSTRGQLGEFFKSSVIWKDIQDELDVWLDEVHMQLENNDGEFSTRVLDRLGGSAEAIRNFMDFQKVIMTNYDIDMEKPLKGGNNDA
jgi:hypothetical protein